VYERLVATPTHILTGRFKFYKQQNKKHPKVLFAFDLFNSKPQLADD
jgi:hypothetical protein